MQHSYLIPYIRKFLTSDSNMATVAMDISNNDKIIGIVQLATSKDVSAITILTDYEKLAHICEVTNAKLLESSIWKQNY